MFSRASVCPRGGGAWQGDAWHGVCMGACVAWGHAWQGGVHGMGACVGGGACMAGETTTAADSTHPTGMHSCFLNFIERCHLLFRCALSNLN